MSEATPPAVLVGEADVAWFAKHGWWVSPRVLTDPELDALAYGVDRFYARDLDVQLPAVPPGDSDPGQPDSQTLQNDYVSLQVDEIRNFVMSPMLGSIAGILGSHTGLRLFHDQLISKAPGPALVGWHTDRSYWLTCSSQDMLTIWVPLQDVDESNGGLQVVDSSHALDLDHNTLRGFHATSAERQITSWPSFSVRTLRVRRGQVSVHHARTVHGSGPNTTRLPRVALAIHLQPEQNHYVPPPAGAPTLHFNDVLCRRDGVGHPDYHDPYVCPIVWPQESGRP
ncbi:ectoine hydroxylase-related dioxygenase (phytanoyl-CoA dioxygenase family) [Kribbella voronezhensis]|uniref:Ectoine hydroxylase-related dioxygenase (Phytanoyl-CoA dioxygenase family) n=1 Tax=Kribbella voronezhensis TaxID=2512212 RepID=A0A4R7SXJ9_9ACTN|nr:phytanoyl-CoA dioxygenase family protein [Kribbella voronezhensis]TDU84001.1 ectoine hydroxylase-related dioxygenase (phytanoyl-CoA dioxygenase family) [Kribbella voronezhensis]